ncbi:MAG: hypothetical protein U0K19_03095, partial [Bifidobacteriaceae bacterium]|nr:hypothetical protein [Bifidobacteriaceae bacterium]
PKVEERHFPGASETKSIGCGWARRIAMDIVSEGKYDSVAALNVDEGLSKNERRKSWMRPALSELRLSTTIRILSKICER